MYDMVMYVRISHLTLGARNLCHSRMQPLIFVLVGPYTAPYVGARMYLDIRTRANESTNSQYVYGSEKAKLCIVYFYP